jgi:hypothetical protein
MDFGSVADVSRTLMRRAQLVLGKAGIREAEYRWSGILEEAEARRYDLGERKPPAVV